MDLTQYSARLVLLADVIKFCNCYQHFSNGSKFCRSYRYQNIGNGEKEKNLTYRLTVIKLKIRLRSFAKNNSRDTLPFYIKFYFWHNTSFAGVTAAAPLQCKYSCNFRIKVNTFCTMHLLRSAVLFIHPQNWVIFILAHQIFITYSVCKFIQSIRFCVKGQYDEKSVLQ